MQILITLKPSYSISLLAKFPMQFFSRKSSTLWEKKLFRDLPVKLTGYKRDLS